MSQMKNRIRGTDNCIGHDLRECRFRFENKFQWNGIWRGGDLFRDHFSFLQLLFPMDSVRPPPRRLTDGENMTHTSRHLVEDDKRDVCYGHNVIRICYLPTEEATQEVTRPSSIFLLSCLVTLSINQHSQC